MSNNGIRAYRNTEVVTSNPGKLVVMCYEGAIVQLKLAQKKFQEKDFEAKGRAIRKSLDIIDELVCALDLEKGGEIAQNLQSIYNYCTRRILQADIARDLGGIDEVVGLLEELLSAWKEIVGGSPQTLAPVTVSVSQKRLNGPLAQYMGV